MGIENLQHFKKGDKLQASTINAIIDHVKNIPMTTTTPGGVANIRAKTLFYTDTYIPAYSIFPLMASGESTFNTFYAQYCVEQYKSENTCRYIRGYFGTNGRYPIYAKSTFYGCIISRESDTPIKICDYEEGKTQCGFKDRSWEATIKTAGLIINGKAPQGEGCFYIRHSESSDNYLLELKYDIPPGIDRCGKICVTSGEAWVMDREHNEDCEPICENASDSASFSYSGSEECEKIIRQCELGERVFNNTRKWFRAKDRCGNKILYFGFRDIFGTIWLDRPCGIIEDVDCCSSSSSSSSSGSSESSSSGSSESSSSEGSSEWSSEGSTESSESEDSRGSYCDYTGVVHTIKDIIVNGGRVTFTLQRMTFRDGLLCDVEDGDSETVDLCNLDCGSSSGSSEEECEIQFFKVLIHVHQEGGEEIRYDSETGEYEYSKPIDVDIEGWTPWGGGVNELEKPPFAGMGLEPSVNWKKAYPELTDFIGVLGSIDSNGRLTATCVSVLDKKCWDNYHSGSSPESHLIGEGDERYYQDFYDNRLNDGTWWGGNWYMTNTNGKAVRFTYNEQGEPIPVE